MTRQTGHRPQGNFGHRLRTPLFTLVVSVFVVVAVIVVVIVTVVVGGCGGGDFFVQRCLSRLRTLGGETMGYWAQFTQVTVARTHCCTRKGEVSATASSGNAVNRKTSGSIYECLTM